MGVLQNWNDWAEKKGDQAAELETQLTSGIMEFVCDTYASKTGAFLLSPFAKGYLKNKCTKIDIPPPPELIIPENTGRCPCVAYDVLSRYTSSTNDREPTEPFVRIQGRFHEMRERVAFDDGDSLLIDDLVAFYECSNGVENGRIRTAVLNRSIYRRSEPDFSFTYREIRFVRVDGQPDDCVPTPELTEEERETTIIINNYDSSNNFVNETELTVRFNKTTNITAPISLDVGGVEINIGSEGISSKEDSSEESDREESPDQSGDGNPDNDPGDSVTFNTRNKVTIKQYRPPNPETYDVEEEDEVEEKEELVEPGKIGYVLIEVTGLPLGGRYITFPDEADNTFFAGYISWVDVIEGVAYRRPEQPIRKKYNSFPVPLTAQGYRVYSVNGAKLKVTTYKEPSSTE